MVDGGSVPFSVVYLDGQKEVNVGNVTVDPSFNFKKFLAVLSQKIGISPHQFSVYLASFGSNRKIPITGKVNFAAIAREKGASFFFVKRSRRNKTRNKGFRDEAAQPNKKNPPDNVMLLRRNAAIDIHNGSQPFSGFNTTTPILDLVEYEKRLRDLQMERERYLMNTGLNDVCLGRGSSDGGGVVCEECSRAKQTGRDARFHWCVYDAVTVGFRSPAGPVARPVRGSG